jgi:2-polyprenyl-3-methyl-5-hydroxy-6-metoxy-1,4-benzoquinol methylase
VNGALSLPFDVKKFDIVTSLETIEHLKDPAKFFRERHSVLRVGGKLVIPTPNRGVAEMFADRPLDPLLLRGFSF